MRSVSLHSVASLLAIALAGCPDRTIGEITPTQVGEVTKEIAVNADLDILFVIDSSGSTLDKQAVFAANFPRFVAALDAFEAGRPNLHIAVVNTTVDIGVPGFNGCPHPAPDGDGRMQSKPSTPGCPVPNGPFISDIKTPSGTRLTNYPATSTLADTFSCIAKVGAAGCGFEAPLEAMKRALDGSRPENAGFLRRSAFLVVVILTDEDDASVRDPAIFALPTSQVGEGDFRAQPMFAYRCDQAISPAAGSYTNCRVRTDSYLRDPAEYYEFLSTVKPAGRTLVALIGGDPASSIRTGAITSPFTQPMALLPSCSTTINGATAIGRPAIRLMDFVSRFADHGLFRTVCQPDYSEALADVGQLLFDAVSPCLEGSLDTTDIDPANPGVQLDCTVSDIEGPGTSSEVETPIRACEMTDATTPIPPADSCYWVLPNPAKCSTTSTLEIKFERSAPPSPDTTVRVRCASEPE